MNIALVCDYSLDYLGGAQTAFGEQARALVAAGHRVVVIAPRGTKSSIGASVSEWIDAPFRVPGLGLPFLRNTAALRGRLAQIMARHHIEIVHVHSEFGLAAAAIDTAAALRVPVVHTVHTFFWQAGALPDPVGRILAHGIRRAHGAVTGQARPTARLEGRPADVALREMTLATALLAEAVISPSEHQRARLLAAGVRSVTTLTNTTTPAGPRASALTGISGPLRVVWIGRCVPEKRLLVFVDACIRALDRLGPRMLEVEIVGDGPLLRRARRLARRHPEISFTGRLNTADVAARLRGAHVAALTSSGYDNQPMTVVEALAASRPVIYVDPALREGLDTAGLLCAGDGADAIAAMLVSLARDPQRVVRASARAELAFDRFSPASFVADLEDVYRQLQPGYRLVKS